MKDQDYSKYSVESKKSIAAVVATVGLIKAVLDTAILAEEDSLTDESQELLNKPVNQKCFLFFLTNIRLFRGIP